MKKCPVCGQTYTDNDINFCLNDGELLSRSLGHDEPPPTVFADDSPPTLMMNAARITNQTNFQEAMPPVPWQAQTPMGQSPMTNLPAYLQPKSHTLPTVALILGISSAIMVCCFGGVWLGLPAAITGFLGMRNADNYPDRFGGRGMALAGIILGTITFFISLIHLFFVILGA